VLWLVSVRSLAFMVWVCVAIGIASWMYGLRILIVELDVDISKPRHDLCGSHTWYWLVLADVSAVPRYRQ